MNVDGTNTAHSTSAMEISAAPTSSIVVREASRGDCPAAMLRSTFSTTTIASSTTMPMASTSPNSDRLLSENPNRVMTKKVPMSEIGIASSGMTAARQVCRNSTITTTTSSTASKMVSTTARTDCLMNCVGL